MLFKLFFQIIDMLVGILQNGEDRTSNHAVLNVCILCYQVLQVYLMGDNRNNELYITQYVDFISNQATSLVSELMAEGDRI